jgi:hypothetical protein
MFHVVGMLGTFLVALLSGGDRGATTPKVPVLAELFTSEGCSSCPPADDLLRRLIAEQPVEGVEVIALSEHVDYWDRLGWKDPFSSPQFTRRQNEYARALGRNDIYTPQLVIDGRLEAIGSDWSAVRRVLVDAARAPRAALAVTAATESAGAAVSVHVSAMGLPPAASKGSVRVLVAIVEDELTTAVLRGENARRRLRHSAVTRSLVTIASIVKDAAAGEFSRSLKLEPAWRPEHLRIVAFLQDERTRRVLGAAAARIDVVAY